MSFNLSISDKPTHVVVWTENSNVSDLVKTLTERVASLEAIVSKLMNTSLLSGIEMRRREDSISIVQESDSKDLFKELIQIKHVIQADAKVEPEGKVEPKVEPEAKVEDDAMEVEVEGSEAEVEAEVEDEDSEAEDSEVEGSEETEEDEEALELEEFEYKGVTYFKDTENQVYQVDSDGDLDDTPIGVWSQDKQKILKYAKA